MAQAEDMYQLYPDQAKNPVGTYARNCRLHACYLHYNGSPKGYTLKDLYDDACDNGLNLEGSSYDSFRQRLHGYRSKLLKGKVEILPLDRASDKLRELYSDLACKLDTTIEVVAKSKKKSFASSRKQRFVTERLLIDLM